MSRAVRSQLNSRARARPRSRRSRANEESPSSRSIACAIAGSERGSNSSAASPATSGSEERIGTGDRYPAGHGLEHGQPKALVQGGIDEGVGECPQALDLPSESQPSKRTSASDPELGGARAQLGLMPGGVAGQHQHRPALGGDARERADQREQVLVGALGGERQQHPPIAQVEARARRLRGERGGGTDAGLLHRAGQAAHGPQPLRHHVDPLLPGGAAARRGRGAWTREIAITRVERRAASGTSTRMPRSRRPGWASGKRA